MGKFDGVIIVSDIDGTFLGKDSRIVPENMQAIEYFKREGGLFTIATGRPMFTIPRRIPMVSTLCNAPVIACNGAYIYDPATGSILCEEFLPEPEISGIVEAARGHCPDISMRITCGGKHIEDKDYPIVRPLMDTYPGCIEIVPYENIPHGKWHQITWMDKPEALKTLQEVILPMLRGGCACAWGGERILEVCPVKGTKGAMLARLKSPIGKEDAVLWAIGDYENDLNMLQMADRRAVPENAIDSLRRIPGVVGVCHHDEGAIAWLIRYIEKERMEAV